MKITKKMLENFIKEEYAMMMMEEDFPAPEAVPGADPDGVTADPTAALTDTSATGEIVAALKAMAAAIYAGK